MQKASLCVAVLAIAVCSVAVAEPRSFVRTADLTVAESTKAPVSLVGFFHGMRGGYGYAADCGCDVAAPSCGIEPTCGAAPSCGCDSGWDDYCCTKRHRHHCRLFGRHHHHCNIGCGCEVAAPSCGIEPSCGVADACGCDAAPMCGCGHRHKLFGHHGCGWGCGRCGHVCKPIRFWANGWCGQVFDGYYGGNPPDCVEGAVAHPVGPEMAPGKALPPEPMPMDEPAPAKSTRRPLLPSLPIGLGVR